MRRGFLTGLLMMAAGISVSAQDWTALGLTGKDVQCITVDDSGRVIAGTHNVFEDTAHAEHVYVGNDSTNTAFQMISYSLPIDIRAIARANPGQYVAVGLGWYEADGDGIFVTNGMSMAPFYTIGRTNRFVAPSAIAVRTIHGPTRDTIHVFVSNGTFTCHGLLKYGSVTLDTIKKIPANPFGSGKPFCAAMCVYGSNKLCYAGGYDTAAGASAGSLMCEVRTDSMSAVKSPIKVTALAAGKYLYVGTKDDGLYRYEEPASAGAQGTWTHSAGPAAAPITGIAVISASTTDDNVYVAVTGGVYKCTSALSGAWSKLGTIAAAPVCLAASPGGRIYAGTVGGVYAYTDNVGVRYNPAAISHRDAPLTMSTSAATLDFHVDAGGGARTVKLFDLGGRLLAMRTASSGTIAFDKPAGPCAYQVVRGATVVRCGKVALP